MKLSMAAALCALPMILSLSACVSAQDGTVNAALESQPCETSFAAANSKYGLRRDHLLELTAQLACYYGGTDAEAQIKCSIPVDPLPIFNSATNDTGGLKDRTSAMLLASAAIGRHAANVDSMTLLSAGVSDRDHEACLQVLHDRADKRAEVRKLFPALVAKGY